MINGLPQLFIKRDGGVFVEYKFVADDNFKQNIEGAKAAGMLVGIYFFSQAIDEQEAREEAKRVMRQILNNAAIRKQKEGA